MIYEVSARKKVKQTEEREREREKKRSRLERLI